MRSGDGRIKIELKVLAWPTHGSTCVHILHDDASTLNHPRLLEKDANEANEENEENDEEMKETKETEKEIMFQSCNQHNVRNFSLFWTILFLLLIDL